MRLIIERSSVMGTRLTMRILGIVFEVFKSTRMFYQNFKFEIEKKSEEMMLMPSLALNVLMLPSTLHGSRPGLFILD